MVAGAGFFEDRCAEVALKKNGSNQAEWVLQSAVAKSLNSKFAFREVRPAATETSGADGGQMELAD